MAWLLPFLWMRYCACMSLLPKKGYKEHWHKWYFRKNDHWIENIITINASFSIIICILSAVYTTLVFSLIVLYSKTALGLGLDSQFMTFFSATSFFRDSGFRSFISALVSFQISFICSVFLSTSMLGEARWILAWFGIFGSMLSSLSLFQILGSANSLLFSSWNINLAWIRARSWMLHQ